MAFAKNIGKKKKILQFTWGGGSTFLYLGSSHTPPPQNKTKQKKQEKNPPLNAISDAQSVLI